MLPQSAFVFPTAFTHSGRPKGGATREFLLDLFLRLLQNKQVRGQLLQTGLNVELSDNTQVKEVSEWTSIKSSLDSRVAFN